MIFYVGELLEMQKNARISLADAEVNFCDSRKKSQQAINDNQRILSSWRALGKNEMSIAEFLDDLSFFTEQQIDTAEMNETIHQNEANPDTDDDVEGDNISMDPDETLTADDSIEGRFLEETLTADSEETLTAEESDIIYLPNIDVDYKNDVSDGRK